MGILGRYIFRQIIGVSILCVLTLTGVLWLTQALQKLDLVTSKGQTLGLFLQFTLLSLPGMLIVIVPVAFFIGCIYVLNRLNNDSELVIISASGASRWLIIRPVLAAAIAMVIVLYLSSLVLVPMAWRTLRVLITEVRSDVLATIVQEGSFSTPENGLVFHVRGRGPGGVLQGLLVYDSRDSGQESTYIAKEARIIESGDDVLLVMNEGSVQQVRTASEPNTADEISVVTFDRYVLDLSQLSETKKLPSFKPRERTIVELMFPDENDSRWLNSPGKFRSELNERFAGPLYPLPYAMIALAAVGFARSNREKRMMGIVLAVAAVLLVRLSGFGAVNLSAKNAPATVLVFAIPAAGFLAAFLVGTGWLRYTGLAKTVAKVSDKGGVWVADRLQWFQDKRLKAPRRAVH